MSTAKRTARSRSRSDAADTPSTKRSDAAAEDTPFSQQASSLEFLPDSQLPNGQELARLNGLIHGDVKEDVSGRTIQCQDVTSILHILDKRCQFLDTVSYGRSLRADDQALDHFVRIAQAAFQQEDYSRLMLISVSPFFDADGLTNMRRWSVAVAGGSSRILKLGIIGQSPEPR